jgi:hypothetical protein
MVVGVGVQNHSLVFEWRIHSSTFSKPPISRGIEHSREKIMDWI